MYCSSLCMSTILLACYYGLSPSAVNGADVLATNAAISRYMADAPKHTVETSGEYRDKELAAFLKTGKMPGATSVSKKDAVKKVKKVAVDKMQDVPTEVLMKQFLDGGSHIKKHLDATGRGRGPDGTSSPTAGIEKSSEPSKSAKGDKGKKKKNKGGSDSFAKAPKSGKKDSKGKKEGKKHHSSDYPSSSPTPTLPGSGDVSLPPNYANGKPPNHENVEHDQVGGGNGSNGEGHQDDGRSTDGTVDSESNADLSSPSNSSSITKIVSPLAAFAGLILIAGVWISRRRSSDCELDQDENLMKHTREGFDVETGTVSGNTYRTGAFTEDDGTLEESVDAHEENRRIKMSQNHAKEMVHVLNDLEEVSINDDGASTTSVSSGYHSPTNSCDGSLIEAARAAMSAEALQPDKSKVYDSSVKPEWATRTSTTAPDEENTFASLDDASSVRTSSYKKFIEPSLSSAVNHAEQTDANDADVVSAPNLSETIEIEDIPIIENTSTPAWMKTQLRPVSEPSSIPKSDVFNEQAAGVDTEPEWMKKFKQMGLEKKD